MSTIISAFLTLVLTFALSHGQGAENSQALLNVESATETESQADGALESNRGLAIAADAHLNSNTGLQLVSGNSESETPTPSPSLTPTPAAQETESQEPVSSETGIGAEISETAQSESTAEVTESAQDNAGENHGQAVSAQAKTEIGTELNLLVPTFVTNLRLGL